MMKYFDDMQALWQLFSSIYVNLNLVYPKSDMQINFTFCHKILYGLEFEYITYSILLNHKK